MIDKTANIDFSKQITDIKSLSVKTGIVFTEILAVLKDQKPVMVVTFPDMSAMNYVKEAFPNLYVCSGNNLSYNAHYHVCAISKTKTLAKKAAEYLSLETKIQGTILGYPKCCVEQHGDFSDRGIVVSSPLGIFNSYKKSKNYSYLLNNLLNFYSRMGKVKQNFEKLNRYRVINKDFPIAHWNLQYISHIPCQYDCQESIKIGKQISTLLRKYDPEAEKIIRYSLSKPILFFNTFKLFIFDGYIKKGILFYNKVIPPYFPVNPSLAKVVNEGNQIKVDNNQVIILKNDSIIFTYQKKGEADGFILDFSSK